MKEDKEELKENKTKKQTTKKATTAKPKTAKTTAAKKTTTKTSAAKKTTKTAATKKETAKKSTAKTTSKTSTTKAGTKSTTKATAKTAEPKATKTATKTGAKVAKVEAAEEITKSKETKKDTKKEAKKEVVKKEKVKDKKEDKKDKKAKKDKKEKKPNKFIEVIKKRWLIKGTTTAILIAAIVAIFIAINMLMQKWELTPIDFTEEKLFTLTEESKEKVKDIDKDVNIYFVGYSEDDSNLDLAKQYKKANEKIVAEAVDPNNRPDLVQKYGIESGNQGIIVECGDKSKVLTDSDLVTYDMTSYETINIAEEKLTSAIKSVTANKIPKVYFLEGYSEFSLNNNMNYLNMFLQNEVNEVKTLNILSTGKVPDDCDTLVITTPNKDFDDVATNSILDYIKSGRNILWLNAAITSKKDLPNVNKILAEYGVNPFEVGIIRETNTDNMVSGSADLIIPEIEYSEITKDLASSTGVILINATKINIDEDKLEDLKVEKEDLVLTSEDAYFRTNFNNQSGVPTADEKQDEFLVGAQLEKTIKAADEENNVPATTSKLVIYGENYFITDYQLSQNSQYGAIQLAYNKDLVLNSIEYLSDREEDITARKTTGVVTYTATETQDLIIRIIIFAVPILIVLIGIIVWQVRRRKK